MKLFNYNAEKLVGVKINKKYLRLSAVYRRFSDRKNPYWDFSVDALIDCFNHESKGTLYQPNNGYVDGKHKKDITLASWVEDIKAGNAIKNEFYKPLDKWWTIPALKNVVVSTKFFPYNYITKQDVLDYISTLTIADLYRVEE